MYVIDQIRIIARNPVVQDIAREALKVALQAVVKRLG